MPEPAPGRLSADAFSARLELFIEIGQCAVAVLRVEQSRKKEARQARGTTRRLAAHGYLDEPWASLSPSIMRVSMRAECSMAPTPFVVNRQ